MDPRVSWADRYVESLKAGEVVSFRPRGSSMSPKIESGNLVTVEPLRDKPPETGEVVLCEVAGAQYLHVVKAVQLKRVLIGNNRGYLNGWTPLKKVYGRVTKVEHV